MSVATAPTAPRTRSVFWWNVSKYLVLAFCRVYFRLRVEGRHLVPKQGPVLLVANHSSLARRGCSISLLS